MYPGPYETGGVTAGSEDPKHTEARPPGKRWSRRTPSSLSWGQGKGWEIVAPEPEGTHRVREEQRRPPRTRKLDLDQRATSPGLLEPVLS